MKLQYQQEVYDTPKHDSFCSDHDNETAGATYHLLV